MAERTVLQHVVDAVVDVYEYIATVLGDDAVALRRAIIRDLGGNPDAATGQLVFPTAPLESIKAYRDSADPTAEADLAVVADVLEVFDAVASQVEAWHTGDVAAGVDQLVHSAIDLLLSNYVRLRWPRFYLILEGAATIEEASSTFGAGSNSLGRFWSSLKTLINFLFNPGRGIEQLEASGSPDLLSFTANYGLNHRTIDGLFRLGAAALGWMHINQKGKDITGDLLAGWDAPGLDLDSPTLPRAADVISNTMVSISIPVEDEEFEDDATVAEPLLLSVAYVPKFLPASGLFLAFGGHYERDFRINDRWTFTAKVRSDAGVAMLLGDPLDLLGDFSASEFSASIGIASQPDPLTELSWSLPRPTGTRLDVGHLATSIALTSDGFEFRTTIADSAFVLDGNDNDSFIRKLLGNAPLRLPFSLTLGHATGRGRILEYRLPSASPSGPGVQNSPLAGDQPTGSELIEATIPLGRRFGPVTIHELALRVSEAASVPDGDTDRYIVEADATFSATIGPVYFRLDRVGLGLVVNTGKPRAENNLRLVDAHLSVSPPLGIAVNVDTKIVSGGGTIFHDPAQGTYFGVLTLRLGSRFTLKAVGLVATKNPDGTDGSSFIIIGTLEGFGWQVGPVTIDGLGLLVASDRGFDECAVRAALPTGQLKHLLFPADPVHHAPEILKPLTTFFPAQPGSTMIGILVKLLLGRTELMRLDLAFILQFGSSTNTRLVVLGRLSSVLPTEQFQAVRINLDAVGVFDFDAGTAALDAVLVDSKLMGRFPITGAAAFRNAPAPVGFALAVGGLHPRFPAPQGFPALPRVTVALTNGDNPKLVLQGYVAITANTVQFGASASLFASACGFSIEGHVGFDVLIQVFPPHFLAEFRASVQLKRGSTNLFKVTVDGNLEGPFPLVVGGKATFSILWWDYSVSFGRTLVDTEAAVAIAPVDAQAEVIAAFADRRSWRAELPAAAARMVALRRDDRPDQILLHPMGTLQATQGVAPVNQPTDIDRLGEAPVRGSRRFRVTRVRLGDHAPQERPVDDEFAPGQLFDLSDDERLAAPSFVQLQAGVAFGDDSYTLSRGAVTRSPFAYTEITISADGSHVADPTPQPVETPVVMVLAGLGAAARAMSRDAATRFRLPRSSGAPKMRPVGFRIAEPGVDDAAPVPQGPTMSWTAAHRNRSRGVLVLTVDDEVRR